MSVPFRDRSDAGKQLAEHFEHFVNDPNVVVLALPRGGVPVAYEVAVRIGAPLEILLVRKLGVPNHEEFAMGAIASTGKVFLNREIVQQLRISQSQVDSVIRREEEELGRRLDNYGAEFSRNDVSGKTVILIDDGLATGSSMRVGLAALREKRPDKILIGVPVASASTCAELGKEVDEIVCAETPHDFYAVGQWYEDFSQTTDEEVRALLAKARDEVAHSAATH